MILSVDKQQNFQIFSSARRSILSRSNAAAQAIDRAARISMTASSSEPNVTAPDLLIDI
jgi:hypothetical protein